MHCERETHPYCTLGYLTWDPRRTGVDKKSARTGDQRVAPINQPISFVPWTSLGGRTYKRRDYRQVRGILFSEELSIWNSAGYQTIITKPLITSCQ